MVMSFFELDMPKPVEENAVKISWDRSSIDRRKIRTTIVLDFGKVDWSPEKAAEKQRLVINQVRRSFGVKLERIRK